jgi:enamine deaminase RidA (YjgF/YER057c/UK114 family)
MNQKETPTVNHQKKLINPAGSESIYNSMQFSQAVQVGGMIWISGQVGINEKFEMAEGIEAQARQAFVNLEQVLNEAGGSLEDIVELVTYHISMSDMRKFSKVKSEFIPNNYPAWTAVGIKELVLPGLLVEIKATAVINSGTLSLHP